MPLSAGGEVSIQHRQAGSTRLPWATTYQIRTLVAATFTYDQIRNIMLRLATYESQLYYSNIMLTGAGYHDFTAKTVVPDPTPPPYDPSEHVAMSFDLNGQRSLSGQQLFYDQVFDVMRAPEYGNIGHIEIRGGLAEVDVDQTLSQRTFTAPTRADLTDRIAAFWSAIQSASAEFDFELMIITQPLLSTNYTIGDNGKPKATRTYGAAQFRPIVDMSLGLIRTDKGSNRYFDHDV